tara:strand:- start:1071 stop:1628 length:558 start_codon:yes stop_codon:yes gene_type:complete
MDDLKSFLEQQQETYSRNNTYEFDIFNSKNHRIKKSVDLNFNEDIFYKIIRNYRNYKIHYIQGKFYQNANIICITSCNRNTKIYKYNLLDHKLFSFENINLIINNKIFTELDFFENKLKYSIEENYENLSVYINNDLKIYFEKIGDYHKIKISLSLEKNIPELYLNTYLNEVENIISYINSALDN